MVKAFSRSSSRSFYGFEVTIVCYLSSSNSPNSFDRIEFGRVRRKKNTDKAMLILYKKCFQVPCFVPGCIVQNKKYFPLGTLKKVVKKISKGIGVECRSLLGQEREPVFRLIAPKNPIFWRVEAEIT